MIELAVKGRFASWQESALLHHSSRSRVANEMSADERLDVGCIADMPYHQLESFSTDALSPIGFGNPIAHRGFSFTRRQGAVARRTIAHGSNCLACLVPYNGPCGGIVKYCTDYLQTLFFRKMWRPTSLKANLWVACILIQSLGISVKPRAKSYSICFHQCPCQSMS